MIRSYRVSPFMFLGMMAGFFLPAMANNAQQAAPGLSSHQFRLLPSGQGALRVIGLLDACRISIAANQESHDQAGTGLFRTTRFEHLDFSRPRFEAMVNGMEDLAEIPPNFTNGLAYQVFFPRLDADEASSVARHHVCAVRLVARDANDPINGSTFEVFRRRLAGLDPSPTIRVTLADFGDRNWVPVRSLPPLLTTGQAR